jgi:predicted nucleic acid-binding protein
MNAIDTNVLIYAADSDERKKGSVSVALLDRLASEGDTVLPWQVLCEFAAFLAKARRKSGAGPEAFEVLRTFRERFRIVLPTESVCDLASDIHLNEQVSIWDSLLIAACIEAGVTQRFSEDAQIKPVIRGVRITNPFR